MTVGRVAESLAWTQALAQSKPPVSQLWIQALQGCPHLAAAWFRRMRQGPASRSRLRTFASRQLQKRAESFADPLLRAGHERISRRLNASCPEHVSFPVGPRAFGKVKSRSSRIKYASGSRVAASIGVAHLCPRWREPAPCWIRVDARRPQTIRTLSGPLPRSRADRRQGAVPASALFAAAKSPARKTLRSAGRRCLRIAAFTSSSVSAWNFASSAAVNSIVRPK